MYSEGTDSSQIQSVAVTAEVSNGHETVYEDSELKASDQNIGSEEQPSPTLRRRKSVTFWKRKSSIGLNVESGYHAQQAVVGNENGNAVENGRESFASEKKDVQDEDDVMEIEPEEPRPISPPPIIPELDGLQDGGFLGGEDLFKHIG